MIRVGSVRPRLLHDGPGVSRYDLDCGRGAEPDTSALVRRWGRDRAVPAGAVEELCLLTRTAVTRGIGADAGGISLRLRWDDADHVRVEVAWHDAGGDADAVAAAARQRTAPVMDAAADSWGVEAGPTPCQWMVLDVSTGGFDPA